MSFDIATGRIVGVSYVTVADNLNQPDQDREAEHSLLEQLDALAGPADQPITTDLTADDLEEAATEVGLELFPQCANLDGIATDFYIGVRLPKSETDADKATARTQVAAALPALIARLNRQPDSAIEEWDWISASY